MKKIIIIVVLLAIVGSTKISQAATWSEFLQNTEWRKQDFSVFISYTLKFGGDNSLVYRIYDPVKNVKDSVVGVYTIEGDVLTIKMNNGKNQDSFKLQFENTNRIKIQEAVYARHASTEDIMFGRLCEYHNPWLRGYSISSGVSGGTTSGTTNNTRALCYACQGLRSCPTCKGMKTTSYYGYTKVCGGCNGTGVCWRCNGTGYEK